MLKHIFAISCCKRLWSPKTPNSPDHPNDFALPRYKVMRIRPTLRDHQRFFPTPWDLGFLFSNCHIGIGDSQTMVKKRWILTYSYVRAGRKSASKSFPAFVFFFASHEVMFYPRITESAGCHLSRPSFPTRFHVHLWKGIHTFLGGSLPKMVTIWETSQGFEDDKFLQEIPFVSKKWCHQEEFTGCLWQWSVRHKKAWTARGRGLTLLLGMLWIL